MAIVNMQGVKAENEDRIYIKYAGQAILKVDKITEGVSRNNYPQIKVHLKDKHGHFITDTFILTPNSLWKLKLFAQALEVPTDIVNSDHFAERYTKATIKEKPTNNNGVIYEIVKHETAKANKPFVPPKIEVAFENVATQQKIEELKQEVGGGIDIDEDEIPF